MSFPTSSRLSPSPVAAAFTGIQWDPLGKLHLSNPEKLMLRSAEANPLDYTLADSQEAAAYSRVLLKILAQTLGPSGPSSKVSHLTEELPDAEALQMLYIDPMGVVTHYAITKLCDVVVCLKEKKPSSEVTIASTFYMDDGNLMDEWRPLLRVLHLGGAGDHYAQRGAAFCLSYILIAGCPSQLSRKAINYASAEEPLQALVSWITSQLQSSSSSSLSLVTPTLTNLSNCPEARRILAISGGVGYLCRHIRGKHSKANKRSKDGGISVQQLYELCFCLWTITYECNTSGTIRINFARDNVIKALVDVVTSAPREKVVRVTLSALRNLAVCKDEFGGKNEKRVINGSFFLHEMIGAGLMKTVTFMKERQWTDPDLLDDLNVLHNLLQNNFKEMTSWDVYKAQVESGNLSWGIIHTEQFFKENARKMEGSNSDFALLKLLIALATSSDDDVLAIVCFDLGEFVRHYPNGRAIAKRFGAKEVAMKLIDHENVDVQRHALQCVSKMMVQNWAFIN